MDEKIEKVIERFKNLTRKNCYSIECDEETPNLLDSKLGGNPYLPLGEEYPLDDSGNPMALFAQINFKDVNLEGYPSKGILEIFTDKEFSYPAQYKVLFFEDTTKEGQTNLPEVSSSVIDEEIKIKLKCDTTYMPIADYRFNSLFCEVFNKEYNTTIDDFFDAEKIAGVKNIYDVLDEKLDIKSGLIGGYANFTQTDPRINENDFKYTDCIIKVDSELDDRIMIGDMGIAWLLISKEDLINKNFNKANFDWDCC